MEEASASVKSSTPDTKPKVLLEEMTREDLIAQVKRQLVFLQKAKAKCDSLNNQISSLQSCKDENESLKKKCAELELESAVLIEKNVKEKELELDKLRNDYIKVQKDNLSLEEQIQCLNMKNSTLSEMCQSFQLELSNLNKTRQEDQKQMVLLNEARDAALNSMKDLKTLLKEKDARIMCCEEELKSSKNSGVKLLEKFDSLVKEIENLTSQNASLEADYAEMKRQLKISNDECENWKAKVEELENEKDDYVGPAVDVSELQYKIEELEQELDAIAQEKQQLLEENSRLEEFQRNSSKIEDETQEKLNEFDSQNLRQIAVYLDQIRSLEEDLLKTNNQKDDLSEELDQVKDLQRFLEDETKELHEECRFLKQEVKSLEEQLGEYAARISRMERKLMDKEDEYQRDLKLMEIQLEDNCQKSEKLIAELEEKVQQLETELARKNERLIELETEKNNNTLVEESRTAVELASPHSDDTVIQLEDRVSALEAERNALNDALSQSKHQIEAQNDQIKALNLSSANKTDEMKIEEYEMEITRLNELLANEREKYESLMKVRQSNEDEVQDGKNFKVFNMDAFEAPSVSCRNEDEDRDNNDTEDNANVKTEVDHLTKTLQEKNEMISEMHLQMDSLINQLDDLNARLAEKDQDISSLASKLDKLKSAHNDNEKTTVQDLEATSSSGELDQLVKNQLEELRKKHELLLEDHETLLLSYNHFRDLSRLADENLSCLRQKLELDESLREFCTELETRLDEITLERDDLLLKYNDKLTDSTPASCSDCENLRSEVALLTNKLGEKSSEMVVAEVEKELETALQSIDELCKENYELKERVSQLETTLNESRCQVEQLVAEKDDLNRKLSSDNEEIQAHKERLSQLEATLNESRCQVEQLVAENDDLNRKLTSDNEEIQAHKERLSQLETMLNESRCQVEQLVAEKDELNRKLSSDNEEIQAHKERVSQLETTLNKSRCQVDQLVAEKDERNQKLSSDTREFQALSQENEKLLLQLGDLQRKVEELSETLSVAQKENADIKEELEKSRTELASELDQAQQNCTYLQRKVDELSQTSSEVQKEKANMNEELEKSRTELASQLDLAQQNCTQLQRKVDELSETISEAQKEKANMIEENEKLRTELASQLDLAQQNCTQLQRKVDELSETLSETQKEKANMNEENEKVRTELASQLDQAQQNCTHLQRKVDELSQTLSDAQKEKADMNEENEKLRSELESVLDELNSARDNCAHLQRKVEELCESLSASQNDNSALNEKLRETLATKEQEKLKASTNPAGEETTSKELSDSKEKIEKLKKVVFKLKKELSDAHKNLTETKNLSLCHLQNFQSLQSEYDKLQDDCDAQKSRIKELEQDITSKVSEVIVLKEEMEREKIQRNKLESSLENEKREKCKLEEEKSERESKIIVLRSEFEAEQNKLRDSKNEMKKLESQISILETKLKSEKEARNQTVQKLEESLRDAKKHQLLNLEINDYEATIYNMEEKIKEKDTQIADLQQEIQRKGEKELFLKDEIERLNSQRLTEEYRLENLKGVLEKTKEELSLKCDFEKDASNKLEEARDELEKIKTEKEEWQMRLSETSSKMAALEQSLKNSKENLMKSSKTYEARINNLERELTLSKNEMEHVRKEFESYKVRVHSVLLKQKAQSTPEITTEINERDLERERLEKTLQTYREKWESVDDELKIKNVELETCQREHSLLISKIDKLVKEMKFKEEKWSRQYEEALNDKEASQKTWESERSHIIQQKEALVANFKTQIESLKEEHQLSVDSLQQQLDICERELFTFRQRGNSAEPKISPITQDEASSFDVSSLERQEGEGSECTESLDLNSPTFRVSLNRIPASGFTPLEQLLQSNPEPISMGSASPPVLLDVSSLSRELGVARKKILHLVEVLNESEGNNMKLSEQVRLLKDEIRRIERNKERQEIVSNLEYLKNVMLKFITLPEGNERERLVPVLTTMLKLSSEESNHIQQVATGQYGNAANNAAGWGSYLQWSGFL